MTGRSPIDITAPDGWTDWSFHRSWAEGEYGPYFMTVAWFGYDGHWTERTPITRDQYLAGLERHRKWLVERERLAQLLGYDTWDEDMAAEGATDQAMREWLS